MKNKIYKILNIIYLLFILYLIIINFYNFNMLNVLGMVLASLLLILTTKTNNIKCKKLFILFLLIAVITRIILFFNTYSNIANDYSFFYGSAKNYVLNKQLNNSYIALFPYLYSYIFLLGNFMKIFSTSYNTVLLFNIIFEILGGIFLYLLIKKHGKYDEKKSLLLYFFNPFNIIWTTICCPVIIVNTTLITIFYIIYVLKKCKNNKLKIVLSILLGMMLSISNSLRPIIIILFIALTIWYIISVTSNKKLIKKYILHTIITIIIYLFSNTLINSYISEQIDFNVPINKSGWTIYVGSNYDANGMWNQEDANYLYEVYDKNDNNQTHKILQKEGINRYKKLGFKTILLLIKKSFILGNDIENYTLNEYLNLTNYKNSNVENIIITISLSTFWYFILFNNLFICHKNIKKRKNTFIVPIGIFSIGLFLSTLLVEVSPRYFMPIFVSLIIYSIQIFKKKDDIYEK